MLNNKFFINITIPYILGVTVGAVFLHNFSIWLAMVGTALWFTYWSNYYEKR